MQNVSPGLAHSPLFGLSAMWDSVNFLLHQLMDNHYSWMSLPFCDTDVMVDLSHDIVFEYIFLLSQIEHTLTHLSSLLERVSDHRLEYTLTERCPRQFGSAKSFSTTMQRGTHSSAVSVGWGAFFR